mmetsp:Transcript_115888/g.374449  ORF Transcript_115888/g.374449 Transcript_115888/m.374449 type:complete len:239 (-) Transcript_115888:2018-2734(-)
MPRRGLRHPRAPQPLHKLGIRHDPFHSLTERLRDQLVHVLGFPEGLDLRGLLGRHEAGAGDADDVLEEHHGRRPEPLVDPVVLLLHPGEDRLGPLLAARRRRHGDVDHVLGAHAAGQRPLQCPLLERQGRRVAQCAVDVVPHGPVTDLIVRGHELIEERLGALALHGDAQHRGPHVRGERAGVRGRLHEGLEALLGLGHDRRVLEAEAGQGAHQRAPQLLLVVVVAGGRVPAHLREGR